MSREDWWRGVRMQDHAGPLDGYDRALACVADAAYATALRGLLPFQSVNRLCFDAGARPYDEPVEGFISFDAHGKYAVHRGSPSPEARTEVTLITNDAAAAVVALLGVVQDRLP